MQIATKPTSQKCHPRPEPVDANYWKLAHADWPVAMLALMMFLIPAVGVPSELMLQDTLKSAIASFGVLSAALVFFLQQRHRTKPLLWHGMVWLPLALMLYALSSMVWSHTYLAGVEAIRWFILSLLMWLGLNTLTRRNLPLLFWGIHGGAVAASLWAVQQFWFDLTWFPQGAPPSSTFVNRNFFAEYAVSVLPFSVYLLANLAKSRWLGMMALSLVLNVVALLMTGTRSALLALLVLVPILMLLLIRYRQQLAFFRWPRANKAMVFLVLVAGISSLGTIPTSNTRLVGEGAGTTALQRSFLRAASMTDGKEYTERSFSIRATMWKATARMMVANPWIGVGAGAWEVQIPLYQNADTTLETDYFAHNEFLQLLSEYGLLTGGLVLAVLLAYLLLAVGKTWHLLHADVAQASSRSIVLASLMALTIVSNAGFPCHLAATGLLLMLCMGILASSDAQLGVRDSFFASPLRWNPRFALPISGVLAGCILLASLITHQAAKAENHLVQAILQADSLRKPPDLGMAPFDERKEQALQHVRQGIAINRHYRKLTAEVAEPFAAGGDWVNAVWMLESVALSRPNIYAVWTGLATGYSVLDRHAQALQAFKQVQRLKPEAISTKTLEVLLLARRGQAEKAAQILHAYFDQGHFDYDMVQSGYAIGYQTRNWPLVIRSLELRLSTWPQHAADTYFRLGKVYADPAIDDDGKAVEAFKHGLAAVPTEQKENFRNQVPEKYRQQI